MDPLISVIVPCFQTGKYVARCLNSICTQTYTNLEIIVIDDGSTDDTARIIKDMADKDERIKYIYQQNNGVSAARNNGLRNATGEYITFVDSDDSIKPEMYEKLLNTLLAYNADIVHCSYCRDSGSLIKKIGGSNKNYIYENEEIEYSLLEAKLYGPGCWNKLFKKEIVDGIRFNQDIKITEDLLFVFCAFQKAKKAIFIDSCLYVYHSSDTSSCNNTNAIKKAEDVFDVSQMIYSQSKNTSYESLALTRMKNARLGLYRAYICYGGKKEKAKANQLRQQIVLDFADNRGSKTQKREVFIIKYIPMFFKPIYSVYNRIRTPNWDL